MADIGSLNVRLVANSSQFTKTLTSAGKSVESFGSRIGSMAKTVGSFALRGGSVAFASISAAAIGAGALITAAMKSAFTSIDDMSKDSQRFGTTIKALAGLQDAADLAGVGSESLNKSLQKMGRNIIGAADGNKALEKTFKGLGLNAKALAEMRTEDQFLAITEGVNRLRTPLQRLQATFAVFGKQGADLLPLLLGGAEALREQLAESERFGRGVTQAQGKMVEAANDAITRSGQAVAGYFRQLAPDIAPYIQAIADTFTEAFVGSDGVQSRARQTFEFLSKGFAATAKFAGTAWADAGDWITSKLIGVSIAFAKLQRGITEITPGWLSGKNKQSEMAYFDGYIESLEKEQAAIRDKIVGRGMDNAEMTGIEKFFADIQSKAEENARAAAVAAGQTTVAYDDLADSLENVKKKMDAIAGIGNAPLLDLTGALGRLNQDNIGAMNAPLVNAAANASNTRNTGPQQVRDPQLQQTNSLLQRLLQKPAGAVLN